MLAPIRAVAPIKAAKNFALCAGNRATADKKNTTSKFRTTKTKISTLRQKLTSYVTAKHLNKAVQTELNNELLRVNSTLQ